MSLGYFKNLETQRVEKLLIIKVRAPISKDSHTIWRINHRGQKRKPQIQVKKYIFQ